MPTIVISEFMDEEAVRDLSADFDVLYDPTLVDRGEDLMCALGECHALIVRNRTQVREPLLIAAPRLQAVGRLGVGLDNIDVEACGRRNVEVFPATGANNLSVAEYVVAGLMMLLRGAYQATGDVLSGAWPRSELIGREVSGKQLGLVGFGGIARDVAVRASALGMRVVACDPYVSNDDPAWQACHAAPVRLDALLRESDAVSLHVPLSEETRHLIDPAAIATMQPQSVLINAARGGIVDEHALVLLI